LFNHIIIYHAGGYSALTPNHAAPLRQQQKGVPMYLKKRPNHSVQFDQHLPEQVFPPDLSIKFIANLLNNFGTTSNYISDEGVTSITGAMIASPSREEDPETDQNYVYDWTRDSGLVIMEIEQLVDDFHWLKAMLFNYYQFVRTSFQNSPFRDQAKWKIDGTRFVNWGLQGDGPATRILALLRIEKHIQHKINTNEFDSILEEYLKWILNNYRNDTINIWEEVMGQHFYTYAICYAALSMVVSRQGFEKYTNDINSAIDVMITKRNQFIQNSYVKSSISSTTASGNDLNIDVIFALYLSNGFGQSLSTDAYLVTIEKIVRFFRDEYPINNSDIALNFGISLGRYPGDTYDGEMGNGINEGQPWFISTLIYGTYLYRLVREYTEKRSDIVINDVNASFFKLVGLDSKGTITFGTEGYIESLTRMMDAANRQVFSCRRHSDGAHLSEQYNRYNGFMSSVRDLSWSYKEYFAAQYECSLAYAAIKSIHGFKAETEKKWTKRSMSRPGSQLIIAMQEEVDTGLRPVQRT
jgi:glucoamylase